MYWMCFDWLILYDMEDKAYVFFCMFTLEEHISDVRKSLAQRNVHRYRFFTQNIKWLEYTVISTASMYPFIGRIRTLKVIKLRIQISVLHIHSRHEQKQDTFRNIKYKIHTFVWAINDSVSSRLHKTSWTESKKSWNLD